MQHINKREIFGWAMFDVANSSYTTAIISFVYSAFFIAHIVPADHPYPNSFWSIAIILSTIMTIGLSPILGRIVDVYGYKKRWLLATTVICCFGSLMLWLANPGDVWFAVCFIALSNTAFMLSETFCSSFLTDISNKKNMGLISGLGWGLGYLGGFLTLAIISFGIMTADPITKLSTYVAQNQLVPVIVATFFALASLPTFLLLKDRSQDSGETLQAKELSKSLDIRRVRQASPLLFRFFFAFLFFMAGMNVVIKFIGIYTNEELQIPLDFQINVFLAVQFSALFGAVSFGFLERFYGAKRILLCSIALWIVCILALYLIRHLNALTGIEIKYLFVLIAMLAGTGIGSLQSSSRTVVGLLSPQANVTEMYGFWSLFNRISIVLAMMYGLLADVTSRQSALLIILLFFIIGGGLLVRIKMDTHAISSEH